VSADVSVADVAAAVRHSSIYMASKTVHAPMWRALRAAGARIVSTWIDEAGPGETSDFADLWVRCVTEASSVDFCIVYVEPGEVLKGAFVEMGAALASRRARVLWVGPQAGLSVLSHPRVMPCGTLEDALSVAGFRAPAFDTHGGAR
jgi:hypothetical protein